MKIIRNRARCRKCGDVVESHSVHEFRRCSCGAIAVDGGLSYLRRVGYSEDIEDMSEVQSDDEQEDTHGRKRV